jgi:hypothetical protein
MAWRKGMAWRKSMTWNTSFPSAFYGAFLSTAAFDRRHRLIDALIDESITAICAAICTAMHRF